jgi:hypothetical protein
MKKLLLYSFLIFTCYFSGAQTIGIVGPAANGWPTDDTPTDIMLTDNGDGTHSIDALTLTTGAAKFRENQQWNTSYGGDAFPTGPITNGDIPVQAGVYDIVLDLNNQTYTFTDVSTFTDVELSGSALTSSVMMSTIDGVNYELSVTEFMAGDIVFQEVGTSNTYGTAAFPTGTATAGGAAIPVNYGFYKVNFNLNTLDYSFVIPDVGIVGPAVNGWPDDNNPTPDVLMFTTDGDIYSLSAQPLNDGQLKFRQDLNWNVNWGGDSFPSGTFTGNDINVTAGLYDISFFRANGSYTFTSLSTADVSFTNFRIYPNPTKNTWHFENQGNAISSISIFNAFGKLVEDVRPNSTFAEVNGNNLSSGFYIAQVKLVNGEQSTIKIIKQ